MILASKSPRRKEILQNFGFSFEVKNADIDESSSEIDIKDQIEEISRKKALAIGKIYCDDYIVSADTVVVIDGEILGKPEDTEDAFSMLTRLSGNIHKVITSYSIYNFQKKIDITKSVETDVKFRALTKEMIDWYIKSGEPMDKAGAYGIQGKGAMLVESIQGDFFSVMGFPIGDFIESIQQLGIELENLKSF
ncbi:MAG: Maf family protein [Fusobacteriaceae bacterium]